VPASQPKRQLEPVPPKRELPHIYTLEATGLIVIAILILIVTVVRYWHHIPWSAR
jgi:hypothetical protein